MQICEIDCWHLTASEAITLSKRNIAEGYDPDYWGLEFYEKQKGAVDIPIIATADKEFVYFNRKTDFEKGFLGNHTDSETSRKDYERRCRIAESKNKIKWSELSDSNLSYLRSLLWIPIDPTSPLAALAAVED